jgi:hypothetical protein
MQSFAVVLFWIWDIYIYIYIYIYIFVICTCNNTKGVTLMQHFKSHNISLITFNVLQLYTWALTVIDHRCIDSLLTYFEWADILHIYQGSRHRQSVGLHNQTSNERTSYVKQAGIDSLSDTQTSNKMVVRQASRHRQSVRYQSDSLSPLAISYGTSAAVQVPSPKIEICRGR